jgi:hypothetical protein
MTLTTRHGNTEPRSFQIFVRVLACLWLVTAGVASASAQEMPDPSLIAGKAIPTSDLPSGSITVRVVRQAIGNNMPGQKVTVTVGGKTQTATTDDQGRAQFSGLPQGSEARAEATINGEHLQSDPFVIPSNGGLRVILIAELAKAAEQKKAEESKELAAPPVKGVVVFGGNSRILMQFQSDQLSVFYLLDLINNARTRVDIGGPVIIDLPPGAGGADVLQGSAPNVKVNGNRITVLGPFAPGTTSVQVGYTLRYDSPDISFAQKFPIALQQVTVGVQKIGSMSMTSPQFTRTNELRTEDGTVFLVGNGAAQQAGATLTINLANLPMHSPVPRYVALALAAVCIAVGVWLSIGGGAKRNDDRATLLKRRDSLLNQLEQLELKKRDGTVGGERYARNRQRMLGELEQIYGELDEAGLGPQGGGEGIAA